MKEAFDDSQVPSRFEIRQRLGSGGMGVVYRVYDRERDETVALKTLLHADPSGLVRFKREFRTLSEISHPNLVSLYELVVEKNLAFFTMELIEGVDFIQYVRVSPDRLQAAARTLADGIAALHDAGVVHRDLKPSNVLVTNEGRVVILDFGLAIETGMLSTRITVERHLSGTVAYMSPEQTEGQQCMAASDWYSFGVILYEALAGRLPHVGNLFQVLLAKQTQEPAALVPNLPQHLADLTMALLARDFAKRPSGAQVLRVLGRPAPATPIVGTQEEKRFVGRQSHIAALHHAFESSLERRTMSVYVSGSSGLGKTALIQNFLDAVRRDRRLLILAGRCYERESVPFKAIDGIIDSLTKRLMILPAESLEAVIPRDVFALARAFPVLLQIDAILNAQHPQEGAAEPTTMRRRAFTALRELLTKLGERQPLILYIDDLHWADADSTSLLEDLLRPPGAPPLLLIATLRTEELESRPFLRVLLQNSDPQTTSQVRLAPLQESEAIELAHLLLGPELSRNEKVVATIVREAGGNPFLLEQLVRYAQEGESTAKTGITLREMVESRMRLLPEGTRQLMETLAVAGKPFDPRVAFEAAGLQGDYRPMISALRAAHFIRSSGSVQRVELYHDRLRELLISLLSGPAMQQVHSRLVRALIARGLDDPETLFEHHIGANDLDSAVIQAANAADKAAATFAFDRAAVFFRIALDLGRGTAQEKLRLRTGLGDALANAGRPAEAADTYLNAALEASSEQTFEFRRRAAEQLLMGGHIDQGVEVIGAVLSAVGLKLAGGPRRALLSLLIRRAQLSLRGLGFTKRPAAKISGEDLLRIDSCWAVGTGLAVVDSVRGADFQTRHLLLALAAGEPSRIARSLAVEAVFSATGGRRSRTRAMQLIASAESLSRELEDPYLIAMATLAAGGTAYFNGEWRKAFELGERGEEILHNKCSGTNWELTNAQNYILGALMYLGELREVGHRLTLLLTLARERGNLFAEVHLRTRQNILHLAADDADAAEREVKDAIRKWSHTGFHVQHYNSLVALTQIDLYRGDAEAAWSRVNSEWPALRSSLLLGVQLVRIEARFLKARCAAAAGLPGIALRLARKIESEKMPWANALAQSIRAGISKSPEGFRNAVSGFGAARMALFEAAASRQLATLTGTSTAGPDAWMRAQGIQKPDRIARLLVPLS